MRQLRKLLFPLSLLYGLITFVRNVLYDMGIFKSYTFAVPVIAVGNLSTGGTGKTPQTEYLIRLLSSQYKIATLSRGYKRKSKGYVLADANADAQILGDEPYQFYSKFPDIKVAVDADRKNGIEQLLKVGPEVIILDDAYQHRRVKADYYVLLTAYGDLYKDDLILPAGNLREGRGGAKRANVIIVTKCPPDLTLAEQEAIVKKLDPAPGQEVYFTNIEYDIFVYSGEDKIRLEDIKDSAKILVAGIAKPRPFFEYAAEIDDISKTYPDHHDFTNAEIIELLSLSKNKIILTTEKDYMRLKDKLPVNRLYYLPIKCRFINNGASFDAQVLNFAENAAHKKAGM